MEYTIKKLSDLANVSTRTLRYYDEIGLLKPNKITKVGYRIYTEDEVNKLQQILFYKAMGIELKDIKKIILNPNYDVEKSLIEHHEKLIAKKKELEELIKTLEKTIACKRGEITMSDREKFECFKKRKIKENEEKYGEEIRIKYDDKEVEDSYKKFSNLTEEEFKEMTRLEKEMIEALIEVSKTGNLDSEEAKLVFENHKKWLSFNIEYNKEMHKNLAEMYVLDERFAKYYNDKANNDVVEILRDIILKYTK